MTVSVCGDFLLVDGRPYWDMAERAAWSRGVVIPVEPHRSIAALSIRHGHRYTASVGIIEHWPLLMFEWLVIATSVPPRVAHAAVEALMLAGKNYAAVAGGGIRPVMVVDRRRGGVGIRKMAERLGFAFRNEHLEVLEGK